MKKILSSLTVVVILAGLARGEGKPVKPVTVPFELLRSGHMAVQVKINGKGPYRVIFDTGAPISLLNNKVAKEAGLLKDAEKPLFSLFGTMGQVSVKSFQVGDLKAEDINTIIMDHPTIEAISRVLGPVQGIVGFPFFARYKMTLDYQAKELTFVPNGFEPPDVDQSLRERSGCRGRHQGRRSNLNHRRPLDRFFGGSLHGGRIRQARRNCEGSNSAGWQENGGEPEADFRALGTVTGKPKHSRVKA